MENIKPLTSDDFIWSQDLGFVYVIESQSDQIIAGGQSLSATKIETEDGSVLWQQPGNAFRTTEIVINNDAIKIGGQYNSYVWEILDQHGNINIPLQIPKPASTIYGLKGVQIGSDFWDVFSTSLTMPPGEFSFTLNKNHKPVILHNPSQNFNPLAIAADKINNILYLAGWIGTQQNQVQLYKIDLKQTRPKLIPLSNGLIASPNLVWGDQLVIHDMIWDQAEKQLVFTGDAHNYNSNPPNDDYGIIGSHDGNSNLTVKTYKFNGLIGDGSAEFNSTIIDLSKKYYLTAGSDSVSSNYIANGFIHLVEKANLSIKETKRIDILDYQEDLIKDMVVGGDNSIFIAGTGGVHNIGKSEDIFSSLAPEPSPEPTPEPLPEPTPESGPEDYEPPNTKTTIKGSQEDDNLKGTKKADFIDGKKGDDKLIGSKGNDLLKGNKGEDILKGSKGNDYLDGSKGIDILIGGKGADVFQISKGVDLVKDFNINQGDRIALDNKGKYTIIDDSDGVLVMASVKKQLFLEGADYDDVIAAGVDLFVQPI